MSVIRINHKEMFYRMKIAIVFNNEARAGFKSGWGFSCLIEEKGRNVLFDTGCKGPDLLFNIRKLGYDAKDIDSVVLSHQHWDHTGGLTDLLKVNNELTVFALSSFSEKIKSQIRKKAKLIEVEKEQKIIDNIYTTGLIKNNPDEQSLIVKTKKGIIVIVGCSHPGVDRILKIAEKHGRIHAIIGGFHGFSNLDALKDIEMIGACHCTQHMNEIKERFPEQFKEIKAGDIISL